MMPTPNSVTVETIPIGHIKPATWNARSEFTDASVSDLVASIRANGILTPLLVRECYDDYEIVAGHRRHHAAVLAGLATVPARVLDLTDQEAREVAIIDNLQRANLHPIEEALAFQDLMDEGLTAEQVGANIGKPASYIGRRLRLLQLSVEAQGHLRSGALDMAHAELLMKLTHDQQAQAMEACWWPSWELEDSDEYNGEDDTRRIVPSADVLRPLRYLKEWIRDHVKLDVHAPETLELFPALAEAVTAVSSDASLVALVEVASGDVREVPEGVLAPKFYRAADEKLCPSTEAAVVVFGRPLGAIVRICRNTKCTIHYPKAPAVKVKSQAGQPPTQQRSRYDWKQQEELRERERKILAAVKPAALRAIYATVADVRTEDVLGELVADRIAADEVSRQAALEAFGPLTLKTLGAWHTAGAIYLYTQSQLRDEIAERQAKFDLDKAWAQAEAELFPPQKPSKPAESGKPARADDTATKKAKGKKR